MTKSALTTFKSSKVLLFALTALLLGLFSWTNSLSNPTSQAEQAEVVPPLSTTDTCSKGYLQDCDGPVVNVLNIRYIPIDKSTASRTIGEGDNAAEVPQKDSLIQTQGIVAPFLEKIQESTLEEGNSDFVSLAEVKSFITNTQTAIRSSLEEGSRYKGYKYKVGNKPPPFVAYNTELKATKLEEVPSDLSTILSNVYLDSETAATVAGSDICDFVNNDDLAIREVWIWGNLDKEEIFKGKNAIMVMGSDSEDYYNYPDGYGDVSIGPGYKDVLPDLPQCSKTYTIYYHDYTKQDAAYQGLFDHQKQFTSILYWVGQEWTPATRKIHIEDQKYIFIPKEDDQQIKEWRPDPSSDPLMGNVSRSYNFYNLFWQFWVGQNQISSIITGKHFSKSTYLSDINPENNFFAQAGLAFTNMYYVIGRPGCGAPGFPPNALLNTDSALEKIVANKDAIYSNCQNWQPPRLFSINKDDSDPDLATKITSDIQEVPTNEMTVDRFFLVLKGTLIELYQKNDHLLENYKKDSDKDGLSDDDYARKKYNENFKWPMLNLNKTTFNNWEVNELTPSSDPKSKLKIKLLFEAIVSITEERDLSDMYNIDDFYDSYSGDNAIDFKEVTKAKIDPDIAFEWISYYYLQNTLAFQGNFDNIAIHDDHFHIGVDPGRLLTHKNTLIDDSLSNYISPEDAGQEPIDCTTWMPNAKSMTSSTNSCLDIYQGYTTANGTEVPPEYLTPFIIWWLQNLPGYLGDEDPIIYQRDQTPQEERKHCGLETVCRTYFINEPVANWWEPFWDFDGFMARNTGLIGEPLFSGTITPGRPGGTSGANERVQIDAEVTCAGAEASLEICTGTTCGSDEFSVKVNENETVDSGGSFSVDVEPDPFVFQVINKQSGISMPFVVAGKPSAPNTEGFHSVNITPAELCQPQQGNQTTASTENPQTDVETQDYQTTSPAAAAISGQGSPEARQDLKFTLPELCLQLEIEGNTDVAINLHGENKNSILHTATPQSPIICAPKDHGTRFFLSFRGSDGSQSAPFYKASALDPADAFSADTTIPGFYQLKEGFLDQADIENQSTLKLKIEEQFPKQTIEGKVKYEEDEKASFEPNRVVISYNNSGQEEALIVTELTGSKGQKDYQARYPLPGKENITYSLSVVGKGSGGKITCFAIESYETSTSSPIKKENSSLTYAVGNFENITLDVILGKLTPVDCSAAVAAGAQTESGAYQGGSGGAGGDTGGSPAGGGGGGGGGGGSTPGKNGKAPGPTSPPGPYELLDTGSSQYNPYGMHILVEPHFVTEERINEELTLACPAVGQWGFVKWIWYPHGDGGEANALNAATIFMNAAHNYGMIPVMRLATHWDPHKAPNDVGFTAEVAAGQVKKLLDARTIEAPVVIEVFNEPNLDWEWSGKKDTAEEYADYLVEFYKAINATFGVEHTTSEMLWIGTAGLSPSAMSRPDIATNNAKIQEYIDAMFAHNPQVAYAWDLWGIQGKSNEYGGFELVAPPLVLPEFPTYSEQFNYVIGKIEKIPPAEGLRPPEQEIYTFLFEAGHPTAEDIVAQTAAWDADERVFGFTLWELRDEDYQNVRFPGESFLEANPDSLFKIRDGNLQARASSHCGDFDTALNLATDSQGRYSTAFDAAGTYGGVSAQGGAGQVAGANGGALGPIQVEPGGQLLQGIQFVHPMPGSTLTQGFRTSHKALDLSSGGNGTILAAAPGIVTKVVDDNTQSSTLVSFKQYNNYIYIDHANGIETRYLHHHTNTSQVQKGDTVQAGQAIAKEGSIGWSTGPHLHFEIRQNGVALDPTPYITAGPAQSNSSNDSEDSDDDSPSSNDPEDSGSDPRFQPPDFSSIEGGGFDDVPSPPTSSTNNTIPTTMPSSPQTPIGLTINSQIDDTVYLKLTNHENQQTVSMINPNSSASFNITSLQTYESLFLYARLDKSSQRYTIQHLKLNKITQNPTEITIKILKEEDGWFLEGDYYFSSSPSNLFIYYRTINLPDGQETSYLQKTISLNPTPLPLTNNWLLPQAHANETVEDENLYGFSTVLFNPDSGNSSLILPDRNNTFFIQVAAGTYPLEVRGPHKTIREYIQVPENGLYKGKFQIQPGNHQELGGTIETQRVYIYPRTGTSTQGGGIFFEPPDEGAIVYEYAVKRSNFQDLQFDFEYKSPKGGGGDVQFEVLIDDGYSVTSLFDPGLLRDGTSWRAASSQSGTSQSGFNEFGYIDLSRYQNQDIAIRFVTRLAPGASKSNKSPLANAITIRKLRFSSDNMLTTIRYKPADLTTNANVIDMWDNKYINFYISKDPLRPGYKAYDQPLLWLDRDYGFENNLGEKSQGSTTTYSNIELCEQDFSRVMAMTPSSKSKPNYIDYDFSSGAGSSLDKVFFEAGGDCSNNPPDRTIMSVFAIVLDEYGTIDPSQTDVLWEKTDITSWEKKILDLSHYKGKRVILRFQVSANPNYDQVYPAYWGSINFEHGEATGMIASLIPVLAIGAVITTAFIFFVSIAGTWWWFFRKNFHS